MPEWGSLDILEACGASDLGSNPSSGASPKSCLRLRQMNKSLRELVTRARANRVSGSSDIVLAAAMGVIDICDRGHDDLCPNDFRRFAVELANSQPNMASIWNLSNSILFTDLKTESVADECRRAAAHHKRAPLEVGKRASKLLLGRTVVTNSSSRAVFESLKAASVKSSIQVYITESRPMREGVMFANSIARFGIDVIVVGDAALSTAVSKSDIALAGADSINHKSIVGKIGLMSLALSAKEYGIDAVICADTSKFAPIPFVQENRPVSEILKNPRKAVRVENVYFEEVPHHLVDLVMTESRQVKGRQISGIVSKVRPAKELTSLKSTS